ncbi:DNA primase family protein [Nocardioides baekrokdamisoli]|nr:phage/plasmid primase, P4 family [Nocardioides baekrokdamisoli]
MAAQNEPGVVSALEQIKSEFIRALPAHRARGWTDARSVAEFDRAVLGAIQKYGNLPQLRALSENRYRLPDIEVALPDGQQPGEFTDAALAPRIARELSDLGSPVAWNSGLGWLQWTGKKWLTCDVASVTESVRRHVQEWFGREVNAGFIEKDRFAALRAIQARGRINAVVALMQGHVEREQEAFDRHLDLLNAQNGVVDLRTGEVKPHDPEYGFTRITAVDYNPASAGTSADWALAKEALPELEREYLLARLGQAVTGYPPDDDRLIFLVGGGANGKTTLMKPVIEALGEFAGVARQEILISSSGQHPEVFMDLFGRRVMLLDETAEGRLDSLRLKRLVGTEKMTGRHMYRSAIVWDPTHAILVASNHLAEIPDSDRGTWRRLLLIKFPFVFGGNEDVHGDLARPIDVNLRHRLNSTVVREAVVAELVQHAMNWFASGMRLPAPPTPVLRETHAWRDESDLVGQFAADCLVADPGEGVALSRVTAAYNAWAAGRGHAEISQTMLKKRLISHERLPEGLKFVEQRKRLAGNRNPIAAWVGVRLSQG